MRRKKILFTIPNFDTAGSGKALLKIAVGLDKDVFESEILCLHDKGAFFKEVEKSGLKIHVFDYIPEPRPIVTMLKECWKVSRQLKQIDPDIIHSFHYSATYTEAIAARMAGIPWVFTKKNMNWGGASKNAWKLRSFLANGIAVQNTDMLRNFYPKSKKTMLIPRGVDVTHFSKAARNTDIEANTNTPKNDSIIISVANFVPVKGIETLILAFKNLQSKHPDWSLWLIGDADNDYGKELKQLVNDLELSKKVYFSGRKADVRPYLNQADIFVLPTKNEGRREGSPVAILEAMANAKVVLGSNISGIKDQLEAYPDFLFKAGDINALTVQLNRLMGLTDRERRELGTTLFHHVSQHYPVEKEIALHAQLYNKVLKLS